MTGATDKAYIAILMDEQVASEVSYKLEILRDEPELLESYGISEDDVQQVLDAMPDWVELRMVNGREAKMVRMWESTQRLTLWLPTKMREAVCGEMENHTDILRDQLVWANANRSQTSDKARADLKALIGKLETLFAWTMDSKL